MAQTISQMVNSSLTNMTMTRMKMTKMCPKVLLSACLKSKMKLQVRRKYINNQSLWKSTSPCVSQIAKTSW